MKKCVNCGEEFSDITHNPDRESPLRKLWDDRSGLIMFQLCDIIYT